MTKEKLLLELQNVGILKSLHIRQALEYIDRGDFLPKDYLGDFYINTPIAIGFGQTNSQPLTVVFMLELLDVKPGQKILDLGSGSGWTAALLTFLVGKNGAVTGVEKVKELIEFGQNNLAKYHFKNSKIFPAKDGEFGIRGEKFERILVSAAYVKIPEELLEQLEIGGVMVIPVNNSIFKIVKIAENKITKKEFTGFSFVPLIL